MLISCYLPPRELTNEELAARSGDEAWDAPQILRKTGVRTRHLSDGLTPSDMAVRAARKLFDEHGASPEDIDFVLLCCEFPDYFCPSTVCIVQDKLGIPTSAGALRIDYGCSGYVYGLMTAKGILAAGEASRLLFITAEVHTRMTHPRDRSNLLLLGDASTATLLTADDLPKIGKFVAGTDGSGARHLIVEAGAMAMPYSEATKVETTDDGGSVTTPEHVRMDGLEVFGFTRRAVPDLVRRTLEKNELSMDEIDIFIFHQPNKFLLEMLRDKIKIPPEKFIIDMEETGNTASNSIPLAMKRAMEREPERFSVGTKILIAGFGIGYSWGATVLTL